MMRRPDSQVAAPQSQARAPVPPHGPAQQARRACTAMAVLRACRPPRLSTPADGHGHASQILHRGTEDRW
jgi:hypothetical protein